MASNHEATLTVKAQVADAQRKMHDLERQVDRMTKALDKKSKKLDEVSKGTDRVGGAMLTAGSKAANLLTGFIALTDKFEQLGKQAIANGAITANYTGDIEKLSKAVRGTVDDMTLMRLSNSAMSLGVVKSAAEMEAYAEAASKVGASVGLDAAASIESLNAALGRGSTEMLDNLGIVMKKSDAEREYALQLGKTVKALTEAEKAEAFRMVGMQKIIEKSKDLKENTSTVGLAMAQLGAMFRNGADNLLNFDRVMGDFLVEMDRAHVFSLGLGQIGLADDIIKWRNAGMALDRAIAPMQKFQDELQAQRDQIQAATDAFKEYGVAFNESFMANIYRGGKQQGAVQLLAGTAFAAIGSSGFEMDPTKGEKRKRGGGGGRRKRDEQPSISDLLDTGLKDESGNFAFLDYEEGVRIAERRLQIAQLQEASLERQWQLQQDVFKAEMDAVESRLMGASDPEEYAKLQEEREQLLFDQQVARAEHQIALTQRRIQAEEEAARRIAEAHRRTAQAINDASSLTGGAIQGAADIASTAAEQHGQSAEAAEKKRRSWGAAILAVDAIFYGAKAAAAFAALNPIEGAGFLSAAIISGTKAAQMGASVAGVGGGGGRGGQASGFGDRGPIQRDRANAPSSKVPGSAGSPTSLPGGAKGTSGTVVYVNTQVLGAIDEQAAVKIQRGIEDAARSGRIRMGRPS